jgi:DeoR family transcriptional regulator, deoxyribose operon repressor
LLADSSKFGVVKNSYFADLADIDIIITDTGLSLEWREILHDLNIEVRMV